MKHLSLHVFETDVSKCPLQALVTKAHCVFCFKCHILTGRQEERERAALRDACLVHNHLEKMKAITLMLLTLGREE